MKTLFFTLLMIMTTIVSAQSISNDFKSAIKSDDVTAFSKFVTEENINQCFKGKKSDYTLLALTIKYKADACFKMLVAKKSDLEKSCSSKTPLMYAAKYGRLDVAKALIEAGANPKAKNYKGRTALDYAKKYDQNDVVTYLSVLK